MKWLSWLSAVLHTPSAFNSQSARIVVLFGEDHKKLWDITEETLKVIVGAIEQPAGDKEFQPLDERMQVFG